MRKTTERDNRRSMKRRQRGISQMTRKSEGQGRVNSMKKMSNRVKCGREISEIKRKVAFGFREKGSLAML